MAADPSAVAPADLVAGAALPRTCRVRAHSVLRGSRQRRRRQANGRFAFAPTVVGADSCWRCLLDADSAGTGTPAICRAAARKDRTAARPDAGDRSVAIH